MNERPLPKPAGTWRLGRVDGVDLLIRPSIVLMGVVLVALFAPRFDDRSNANPYALAAVFVIALYVSVFVHELAHVFAARQFVNHGHVTVNGQRVNIASYRVKEGDIIAVREKSRQLAIIAEALALTERDTPDYLEIDTNKLTVKFIRTPGLSDIPYPVVMEPNLVVEYYAKN